ncbi:hypothetical protein ACTMTF_42420 [Nonomuraea sp. ZG12]
MPSGTAELYLWILAVLTATIVSSLFGGMGGCAMIGQTTINVKNGAHTRF